jgi:Phosphopantetheine attachment site
LDSLGSIELRNALESRLGLSLPGTLVLDYPSLDALVDYLAAKLRGGDGAGAAGGAPAVAVGSQPLAHGSACPGEARLAAVTAAVARSPANVLAWVGGAAPLTDAAGVVPLGR